MTRLTRSEKKWKAGDPALFDGKSVHGDYQGFGPVTIEDPHANSGRVTHVAKDGQEYEGAFRHIRTAIVKTARGKSYEVPTFTLHTAARASNPASVLKRKMTETEMASHIRQTHPLGAKITDNDKRLTLDDGSVWLWDARFEHWAMWSPPRKSNPGRRSINPVKSRGSRAFNPRDPEMARAAKLYESFRERTPKRIKKISIFPPPRVAVDVGLVEFIGYRTTHGRKLTLYQHDFAPGSRPLLCVSPDGRQLLLIGGRYKFTGRGIVDRDLSGREIENAEHGKTIGAG